MNDIPANVNFPSTNTTHSGISTPEQCPTKDQINKDKDSELSKPSGENTSETNTSRHTNTDQTKTLMENKTLTNASQHSKPTADNADDQATDASAKSSNESDADNNTSYPTKPEAVKIDDPTKSRDEDDIEMDGSGSTKQGQKTTRPRPNRDPEENRKLWKEKGGLFVPDGYQLVETEEYKRLKHENVSLHLSVEELSGRFVCYYTVQ